MKRMKNLTYSELISIPEYMDRFKYLQQKSFVGKETFGCKRYLNQQFYRSEEWKRFRNKIIVRDNGCDLAHPDYSIYGKTNLYIHHINPITIDDIINRSPALFDPDNVVCVSFKTHNAIHYGDESQLLILKERTAGDTKLW